VLKDLPAEWRPPSQTAEDRNEFPMKRFDAELPGGGPPSPAAEDRNDALDDVWSSWMR
jgi:hypothetical protein